MKFWVGVTDSGWFRFLRDLNCDEVNFWNPGEKGSFAAVEPGTPYLFKLKRPFNHIGGFGTFVSFVRLPLSLAWEAFRERNGAPSKAAFEAMIRAINPRQGESDPEIGCTLLSDPVFLSDDQLIAVTEEWASNIVKGRTYSSENPDGQRLLKAVERASESHVQDFNAALAREPEARYSEPFLARARLGQGTFRVLVTNAYSRRCAMTGENIVPVLDAAHIRPFSEDGPSHLSNGLLLRSDFHRLFDLGYVTVTPDYRIEVSKAIQEEWFNGKAYYRLHGARLASEPAQPWARPSTNHLQWHNEHRFRG